MRWILVFSFALVSGCSRSNNLVLGHVQAQVGSHLVAVTDCYRTSVPAPKAVAGGYRFTPCRDADVLIVDDTLTVNRRSYGRIGAGDSVLVDHGVVSVKHFELRAQAN